MEDLNHELELYSNDLKSTYDYLAGNPYHEFVKIPFWDKMQSLIPNTLHINEFHEFYSDDKSEGQSDADYIAQSLYSTNAYNLHCNNFIILNLQGPGTIFYDVERLLNPNSDLNECTNRVCLLPGEIVRREDSCATELLKLNPADVISTPNGYASVFSHIHSVHSRPAVEYGNSRLKLSINFSNDIMEDIFNKHYNRSHTSN